MIIELKSVGCAIDTRTLVTYPINANRTIDFNGGVHLNKCTDEWVDTLSDDDVILINEKCKKTLTNKIW